MFSSAAALAKFLISQRRCEFSAARHPGLHGLHLGAGGILRRAGADLRRLHAVATFSSHRYWTFLAAAQRVQEMNFYKNMAILGGIFFLFIVGPGRLSIDGWLRKGSR